MFFGLQAEASQEDTDLQTAKTYKTGQLHRGLQGHKGSDYLHNFRITFLQRFKSFSPTGFCRTPPRSMRR